MPFGRPHSVLYRVLFAVSHPSKPPQRRAEPAARRPADTLPHIRDLLAVGYVTKAHGIRGELTFIPETNSLDLISGEIFLRARHGGPVKPFTVVKTRSHHGSLLLSLEGVASRTDAEMLRSHTLFISKDRLPPLDDGEVYLEDLPGLAVLLHNPGGSPTPLGRITAAAAPAGQLLWTITTPDGVDILFPAVEEFVLEIDLETEQAVIDPPPGLLELYLSPDA